MTVEHVVPRWLARALYVEGSEVTHRYEPRSGGNARPWSFVKPEADLRGRVVCALCNSGWMSALENEAKGTLETLALGRTHGVLSTDEGRVVVRWAIKTALVLAAIDREPAPKRALRRIARSSTFHSGIAIPEGIVVFAGRIDGHSGVSLKIQGHALTGTLIPEQTATIYLAFRHLLLVVFVRQLPSLGRPHVAPPFDGAMIELGPPCTSVVWPPARPLPLSAFGDLLRENAPAPFQVVEPT